MSAPPSPTTQDPGRRGGYTLPVWVAAAARAALGVLLEEAFDPLRPLLLCQPDGRPPLPVPVQAAAPLAEGWALAETLCDPGDGLDLTRGLVVWLLARWWDGPADAGDDASWSLEAGEGVGLVAGSGEPCVSAYARALLEANLAPVLPPGRRLRLRLVLPQGRRLAERTSNAAFGVVEGLALIGTQAEVQASADPHQLRQCLEQLRLRLEAPGFDGDLVLVIGENGLDLAPKLGLPHRLLLKCGNWIGPLLVAAGQGGVRRLLLFGVQGKLVKLAAGIFHTHHHLADGRREVLTALAALEGMAGEELEAVHGAPTVDAALGTLEDRDPAMAERLRRRLAAEIEARSLAYLHHHAAAGPELGAALFDRRRRLRVAGPVGTRLLEAFRRAQPGR